jgi:hypothetical protein
MAKVSMKTILNASAEKTWKTVSDFNGLPKFVAAIVDSKMEGFGIGAVRILTLQDGGPPIVEKLESQDDQTHTLSYSIVESPLPLDRYLATVEVRDLGENHCEVVWSSSFEPKGAPEEEAKKIVEGVYSAAFEGLKKLYGAA